MAMKRTRQPWMKADDFGRSLPRGVGLNLLVPEIAPLEAFCRTVLGANTIYADEDTHLPLLADMYDARGDLYRFALNTVSYDYAAQIFMTRVCCYHDLVSGAYMADRLTNELKNKPKFNVGGRKPGDYTPAELKRRGV